MKIRIPFFLTLTRREESGQPVYVVCLALPAGSFCETWNESARIKMEEYTMNRIKDLEERHGNLVERFLKNEIAAFTYMRESIRLGRDIRAAQE